MVCFKPEVVNVKLPRFNIEATYDLVPELKSLGVEEILIPAQADFGNMVKRNLIHLSQFKQKYVALAAKGSVSLYLFVLGSRWKSMRGESPG